MMMMMSHLSYWKKFTAPAQNIVESFSESLNQCRLYRHILARQACSGICNSLCPGVFGDNFKNKSRVAEWKNICSSENFVLTCSEGNVMGLRRDYKSPSGNTNTKSDRFGTKCWTHHQASVLWQERKHVLRCYWITLFYYPECTASVSLKTSSLQQYGLCTFWTSVLSLVVLYAHVRWVKNWATSMTPPGSCSFRNNESSWMKPELDAGIKSPRCRSDNGRSALDFLL